MIDANEAVSSMLENKKLDIPILLKIVAANDLQTLGHLTEGMARIVGDQQYHSFSKHDKSPESKEKQELNQPMSQQKTQSVSNEKQQHKQTLIKKLTEDDVLGLFNIIRILHLKLKGTKHQLTIRQTVTQLFKQLELMPGYNRIVKPNDLVSLLSTPQTTDLEREQKIRMTIRSNTLLETIDSILNSFESIYDVYRYLEKSLLPILTENLVTVKKKDRLGYLVSCCKVFHLFFPALEFQIEIQKNALSESRRFRPKMQIELLMTKRHLLKPLSKLLNEMILCPSEMELQLQLFVLLRRMYHLWGDPVKNPIFTVISNILVYSKVESDLKAVCLFCYRIILQKKDLHLGIMLQNSQNLRNLKQSPYFSSKALAYLDESHCNFSTSNIRLPFWRLFTVIDAGSMKQHLIIVEKQGSLLCWQIILKGYDIRFGLFKVEDLKGLELQDYEAERHCKAIIKLNKLMVNKQGHRGSTLLKSGIYKIVLDNRFSYVRSKQVLYNFLVLEPL